MKHLLIWLAATVLTLVLSILAVFPAVWHWDAKYYDFFCNYRMKYLRWTYDVRRRKNYKPSKF